MTSPLLEQANAYILVTASGVPSVVAGRVVTILGESYLLRCYLPRQESNGTTTGADYLPGKMTPGVTLPGSSGLVYLYKGYGLQWAEAPSGYVAGDEVPDGLSWNEFSDGIPAWLTPGISGIHMQGIEAPKNCTVERITGKYGNAGIDEILVAEIGGIPLLVRSGDLID